MALKRRYDDMTIIKSKLDTFILKYCFRYNKSLSLMPKVATYGQKRKTLNNRLLKLNSLYSVFWSDHKRIGS